MSGHEQKRLKDAITAAARRVIADLERSDVTVFDARIEVDRGFDKDSEIAPYYDDSMANELRTIRIIVTANTPKAKSPRP